MQPPTPTPAPSRPPIRRLTERTHPARCLDCYYVIEGLDEPRCPECGRAFVPNNPATYTTSPPFMWWSFWLPGFLLAAVVGTLSVVALLAMGAWGWALWLAAPMAAAALLGYRVRVGFVALALVGIAFVVPMIAGAMLLDIAGMFCGIILAVIFLAPIMVGLGVGAGLRLALKTTNFSQRDYLPILLALIFPVICGVIEINTATPAALERISTSRIIEAPIDAAWNGIMFYEEVEHQPPLLLRIGLAHPLSTVGSSREVGDVKTCIYNKGRLTKQVTAIERHRILAFAVTEQAIGYERDVRLTGGSFAFEFVDADRTRVTLTTEYEPLLSPRFAWRWGERIAVHTLHGHVLEGMSREARRHVDTSVAMRSAAE